MGAFSDYTSLKATVLDWLVRPDLASVVDTFIELFESEANTRLRTRWQEVFLPSFQIASEFVPVPADHLATKSIAVNSNPAKILRYRTLVEMDSEAQKGQVSVFTIVDNKYRFKDAPSNPLTARVTYWAKIPPLALASTNWLLQNYPAAYLFGSLAHAEGFLKNDERVQMWLQRRDDALASIMLDDERAKFSGPLVMTSALSTEDYGSMTV